MSFFKPNALSPIQIERRRKIQAKGRKHFIVYRGILGWGGSTFIATTLWRWHDEFGRRRPDVLFDLSLGLIVWAAAGYFWGAFLWNRMYGKSTAQD
jgi:hypothetical protein